MADRRTPDAKLIEAGIILARTYGRDELAQSMLTRLATRLAELVEERRWIPVGERLPEIDELVEMAGPWGETIGLFNGEKWLEASDETFDSLVTHWRKRTPGPENKEVGDVPIQK